MLKKQLTYENPLTGEEVTETHYFHLSKADLVEMEARKKGGMEAYLQEVIDSQDNGQILVAFKEIIAASYGLKVGDRFVKDERTTQEFMSSEAYSEFLMSLMQDAGSAAEFVNAIVPHGLRKSVMTKTSETIAQSTPEPVVPDPTGLTDTVTARVLTMSEIKDMNPEELQSGLAEGRYKLS